MKQKKNENIKKLPALILVSVMALLIPLVAASCTNAEKGGKGRVYSSSEISSQKTSAETTYKDLYMITDINAPEETIALKNLSTDMRFRYRWNLLTRFRDRFGGNALLTDFYPGRVVTLGGVNDDGYLKEISVSKDVFEIDEVTNYKIDTARGVFSTGGSNYRISSQTVVLNGEIAGEFSAITENDELKIIGIGHDLLSVIITTGHGYVYVTNTADFAGSLMQIGSRIYLLVSKEDMTVEVPEGDYALTVANKGYGGTEDISVVRGETVRVDLSTLKGEGPKTCNIKFMIEVEGAKVYLDNKEVPSNTEMQVTYGAHSLKVTADGYNTWTRTLYVNSESAEITLDLSDEKKTDQTTAGTSSSSSSSSSAASSIRTSVSSSSSDPFYALSSFRSSVLSSATAPVSGDLDGDGDYDNDDAELQYLQTISDMLTTMTDSDNNL